MNIRKQEAGNKIRCKGRKCQEKQKRSGFEAHGSIFQDFDCTKFSKNSFFLRASNNFAVIT